MWYVIWVTTDDEHWLVENVQRKVDHALYNDIWVPMRLECRKYRDGNRLVKKILFPGYVFVDTVDPEILHENLKSIRSYDTDKNYIHILRSEDRVYLPISKFEEEIIRHLTANSADKKTMSVSTAVVRNGRLVILDGPLKGFEQYIVRVIRHKGKCELRIPLFGEQKKITASIDVVGGVLPLSEKQRKC